MQPIKLSLPDVPVLRTLVATAEQDDDRPALLAEIHPVTRTVINSQFPHTAAHGFVITEVPKSHTSQPGQDSSHSLVIFYCMQPIIERQFTGVGPKDDDVFRRDGHSRTVARTLQHVKCPLDDAQIGFVA